VQDNINDSSEINSMPSVQAAPFQIDASRLGLSISALAQRTPNPTIEANGSGAVATTSGSVIRSSSSDASQRRHEIRERTAMLALSSRGLEVMGRDISPIVSVNTMGQVPDGTAHRREKSERKIRRSNDTLAQFRTIGDDVALSAAGLATVGRSAADGQCAKLQGPEGGAIAGRRSKVGQFKGLGKPPLPLSLPQLPHGVINGNANEQIVENNALRASSHLAIVINGHATNVVDSDDITSAEPKSRSGVDLLPDISSSRSTRMRVSSTIIVRSQSASSGGDATSTSSLSRISRGNTTGVQSAVKMSSAALSENHQLGNDGISIGGIGMAPGRMSTTTSSNHLDDFVPSVLPTGARTKKRIVRGSTVRH
jgi:hypothetical protein